MRQAAQRQGLSVKYLEQLGGALVRAGVLKSIRGVSGGYYLAKPADQIRIGDVLRATEGSCMPVACVDDEGKCDLAGCCEARGFWRGMGNAINAYIDRITLARCAGRQRGGIADSRWCDSSSETGAGKRDGLQLASCSPSFSFNHVLLAMRAREAMVGLSRTRLAT